MGEAIAVCVSYSSTSLESHALLYTGDGPNIRLATHNGLVVPPGPGNAPSMYATMRHPGRLHTAVTHHYIPYQPYKNPLLYDGSAFPARW